jgi:hypothetical protein
MTARLIKPSGKVLKLAVAVSIPFEMVVLYNPVNQAYGGNPKIGYHYAMSFGFDFVALLHGDGQYATKFFLVRPFTNKYLCFVGLRMRFVP